MTIDSTLTDGQITDLLANPLTPAETNEYQNTIDQLQLIENTANPTNAQVIAAVKYLAKTIRILIKLFVKYYQ